MPNSVKMPSTSGPTIRRRMARYTTNSSEKQAMMIPDQENTCSGTRE